MIDDKAEIIFVMINESINSVNTRSKAVEKMSAHVGMSKIITDVNKTITRFKENGNPSWFKRMFTTETVINANLILCDYEFKSFLRKGDDVRKNIKLEIQEMESIIEYCGEVISKFNDAQCDLQQMIDDGLDEHGRISRKLNDVIAASVLVTQTVAQTKLALKNTYIIYDKFDSIDSILRPVLERNIALSKNDRIDLMKYIP